MAVIDTVSCGQDEVIVLALYVVGNGTTNIMVV